MTAELLKVDFAEREAYSFAERRANAMTDDEVAEIIADEQRQADRRRTRPRRQRRGRDTDSDRTDPL